MKAHMQKRLTRWSRLAAKRIDWICVIVGSYMAAYGVFSFSVKDYDPSLSKWGRPEHAYRYFYDGSTKATIALGIALIVLGVLLYKEQRKK